MKAAQQENNPSPDGLLGTVQVLRGVAATLVVLHHTVRAFTLYRPENSTLPLPLLFGPKRFQTVDAIGVDIFFVISGFIMVYVSRDYTQSMWSSADFMARRLLRIYPMYLLVTLGLCAIYVYYICVKGSPPIYDLRWYRIFDSVLFIPSFDQRGDVAPIVGVGWTLYYEMYFYICFAVALAFFRNIIPLFLLAALTGIVLLSEYLEGQDAFSRFFQNTIVFEFVFGCFLGVIFIRGYFPKQISPIVFFLPAVIPLALPPIFPDDNIRFVLWGLPSACVLAGVLCIEARGGFQWHKNCLIFGDASYVIYLIHLIVIYNVLGRLVLKIPAVIHVRFVTDLVILCFVAATVGAGIVLYLLVEAPLRRHIKRWYGDISAKKTSLPTAA